MIAPASTGRDKTRRMVVTFTDQMNRGIRSIEYPLERT